MRHTFLTFILIAFFTTLKAQNNNLIIGISSSLDFNSYAFVEDFGPIVYEGKLNYSAGIVLKYSLNGRFSISTKALFSTKNFQEIIDFGHYSPIDPNDPLLIRDAELAINYLNKFLDIPFELNYRLNRERKLGIYLSLGLVNSIQIDSDKKANFDTPISESKRYNDYLLSAKLGLGLFINLSKLGIFIEPQTRFYLNEVHNEFPNENPIHFGIEIQVLKI